MPVPGRGKTTRSSTASGPRSKTDKPDHTPNQVDGFEGWREGVDVLKHFFKLPDLTSRRGLKKVHAKFDDICERMDDLYQRDDNIQVRGAIVAIFCKMSMDSILRTKLFDRGILDKVVPLLNVDETRHLAFRVLSIMTHHSGENVQLEIARYANKLAKIIRDLPDDERLASLGVATLCHSICPLATNLFWPYTRHIWQSLDIVDIYKTMLNSVKRAEFYSPTILTHTMALLSLTAPLLPASFKAHPPAISFIAAGMRSKHWSHRCSCLVALIDFYKSDSKEDLPLPEQPDYVTAIQREMPFHLQLICMNYAPKECDNHVILTCQMECVQAMLAYPQHLDLYVLGKKLVQLILMTEFPFPQNATFFGEEFSATTLAAYNNKPPFVSWIDGLPLCAKAIREHGTPGDEGQADILDLKYLVDSKRLTEAIEIAKTCLKHDSKFTSYFYYVISLSTDDLQTLSPVKKGLKCKDFLPFVKYHLLQRAVECACRIGLRVWKENLEEAVALFTCALEDAKVFIAEAPPDSRHMRNVCCWYVLLTILFNPGISPDLKELDETLCQLEITDHFSEYIGHPRSKSHLRLVQQGLVKHYRLGVAEFGKSFAQSEKISTGPALPLRASRPEKDLTEWLEEMRREDGTMEPVISCGSSSSTGSPELDHERVAMYCCSWCGNRSAAIRLRLGSKCGKTRYCDSDCQRFHWKEHKKNCKL